MLRAVKNGTVHAVTAQSSPSDLDAIQVCDCQAQPPKTGKQAGEISESDRLAVDLTMSVSGTCGAQV